MRVKLKIVRKKWFYKNKENLSVNKSLPVKYKKEKPVYTKKSKRRAVFKYITAVTAFAFLSATLTAVLILYSWTMDMPTFDKSVLQESAQSSYIYDKDNNVIAKFSSSENRSWVKYEDIPKQLVDAFICTEDIRFFEHGAIDPKRFVSAVLGQFSGDSHGGSTITQQLVKNAYLTNEVTYKRKLQEIIMAYRLEKEMGKEEILEAYLNIIYFGESNYGIKAAADDYFGKELKDLTLKECALLAGLVKNPNGYSPRRNMYVLNDMSKTDKRTIDVLYNMKENGFITNTQYKDACDEQYNIKEQSMSTSLYSYPHFIEYAIRDVVDDMLKKEKLDDTWQNRSALEWKIRSGGYKIYTTLDQNAQKILQETVANYNNYPQIKGNNGKKNRKNKGKPETAAVILDQKDGSVIAMIGSREEPTAYKTLNRALSSTMPVASTIKPLSAFAPAIEAGASPGSIGYNYAYKIDGYDITADYPSGNMGTQRPLTYREAIQRSSNVIPARIICQDLSYPLSKQYLIQMGIDADKIQENGSGLALGTSGINVLQLAGAYATLANGGTYHEPKPYKKVCDANNNVIMSAEDNQELREVFSKSTSWLITNAMQSVIGYNENVKGVNGITTAGKTGTHEDKCAAFAGYTAYYTSVVWIGADNYASFEKISGAEHAAPVFDEYMTKIHQANNLTDKEILDYSMEDAGVTECKTCNISGMLAGELCEKNGCAITEFYKKGTEPAQTCNMHVQITECYSAGALANEECPSYKIKQYEGLFIPSVSVLSKIPRYLVKKTFPDAVFEDEKGYCPYHSDGAKGISSADIKNINLLINRLDNLKNTSKLESLEIEETDLHINELKEIMDDIKNASDSELSDLALQAKKKKKEAERFLKKVKRADKETQDIMEDDPAE